MELVQQYTHKGICISMLFDKDKLGKNAKNTHVLYHNEITNLDDIFVGMFYLKIYTQFQGIKVFMQMVRELNNGIIQLKINRL